MCTSIPAVGPITALTWVLEVGDVQRFSSIKKAVSYCGLCGAEKSSANTVQRTPLPKQRNKHLQTTLIEAAKMAPRNSPELAMLYDKEKQRGNATAQRWRWLGSWWPTSWRSTVGCGIFRWWRRVTASLRKARRQQGGFLRRVACQVLPLSRLGHGAQALDAPVDKFRDWQENTNSIFCAGPSGLRQQMEVWFI